MRGTVEGLATPYPISGLLPAFLQEDPFLVRMTQGFDAVLAPLISVLDCLEAYVDPLLAPADFLPWLASWVGGTVDTATSEDRARVDILASATLHRIRGTAEGIRMQLELATGGEVEVEETGALTSATSPTGPRDDPEPLLVIRIRAGAGRPVRKSAVEDLVVRMKPAHVPHVVEVVEP